MLQHAIRCRYCLTDIQSRRGGDYVAHTCAAMKAVRGEEAIIGVDGGGQSYGRRIIGHREDWVKSEEQPCDSCSGS